MKKETDKENLKSQIIVHKLLSKFCDKIKLFKYDSSKLLVITNYFQIDINEAIENQEVKIINSKIDLPN